MTKDIATKDNQLVQFGGVTLTQQQMDVVTHTIAPGLDVTELELYFYECKRRGVHPLDRLIFPIKRNDNSEAGAGQGKKLTFQCSIDYFRAASEDTGKYLGQKPVEFGPDVPLKGHDGVMVPEYATVTLLRKNEGGDTVEVPATAYWTEYYPGEKMGFMWRKMPKGQLAKCAEALAHRKAFPRELGGMYANEEVERVDTDIPFAKTGTVRPVQQQVPRPAAQAQAQREPGMDAEEGAPIEGEVVRDTWPIPTEFGDSKVKISLYNEVMRRAKGDMETAEQILRSASEFQGNNGIIWIHLDRPGQWKDGWCGKTLNKLREGSK